MKRKIKRWLKKVPDGAWTILFSIIIYAIIVWIVIWRYNETALD